MNKSELSEIKKNTLVYIIAFNERTMDLSRVCFEKLGYENIIIDNSEKPFYKKLDDFRKYAIDNVDKYNIFLRSDADRLVFAGIDELLFETFNDKIVFSSEGVFYDGLMRRKRGGTPVLYKKEAVLLWGNLKVPNSKKPESDFISSYTNNRTDSSWKCYNILTNLHDFEQFPSKICNVLINRFYRGHIHLYDIKRDKLCDIWAHAIDFIKLNGDIKQFKYYDFKKLDLGVEDIAEQQMENMLKYYRDLYLSHAAAD